jgi:hypothetical protein
VGAIVAAGLTSHAPNITARPTIPDMDQRRRFVAGVEELGRRLAAARSDVVVFFVNDHVQNFFYDNLPAFCVGVGDGYWAPSEGGAQFLKIPARRLAGDSAWGRALHAAGLEAGFDLALSHELEFWDDVSVPAHFLLREGTPIVPVLTNCVAPPLPTPRRCWALGEFVRRFVASRPAGERVALVATGGISHWIGVPGHGRINPDFDRRVLDAASQGRGHELAALTFDEIEAEGGNGGQEIRNWIAVLGAVAGAKGEVLAYEPVVEWLTGCGVVSLAVSA